MTDRDVGRFGRWASTYDEHWLQPRFFEPVQEATLDRAALLAPNPRRVLDVGCGTGALMRKAAKRFPRVDLSGVDPAPGMVEAAGRAWRGDREARFVQAAAEHLPFEDGEFDLVTSTLSFHHWQGQQAGLNEIGRVLAPGGICGPGRHLRRLLAAGVVRCVRDAQQIPQYGRDRTYASVSRAHPWRLRDRLHRVRGPSGLVGLGEGTAPRICQASYREGEL